MFKECLYRKEKDRLEKSLLWRFLGGPHLVGYNEYSQCLCLWRKVKKFQNIYYVYLSLVWKSYAYFDWGLDTTNFLCSVLQTAFYRHGYLPNFPVWRSASRTDLWIHHEYSIWYKVCCGPCWSKMWRRYDNNWMLPWNMGYLFATVWARYLTC